MLPTDLPETLPEFLARFGTDEACRDHLFTLRWPRGFYCDCGNSRCYLLSARTNVYECSQCGAQHSLLTGTIFEQTKTGLSKWFLAIYLFAGSKGGISALELKRHLGFGSDQTAWTWLHKIRRAMSVRGAPLAGPVEVDETFLGGPKPGKRGRGAEGKTLAVVAVETRTYAVEAIWSSGSSPKSRARRSGAACSRAAPISSPPSKPGSPNATPSQSPSSGPPKPIPS